MITDSSKRMSTTGKPILGVCIFLLMISCTAASAKIIYVDADATTLYDDGSSWAKAYKLLQMALNAASNGDEIRVAQGTYKPGLISPRRSDAFVLESGVTIKGGYAGYGEPDPNARSISTYETILSGDIGVAGDDSDNCYHVVASSGCDETAVLDGFTVTGGNANLTTYLAYGSGGGMYNIDSSPTVTNCTFSQNSARYRGGGMYNDNSSPTVANCTFGLNSSGGMSNYSQSRPSVVNCSFNNNHGGGMSNYSQSRPSVVNCSFNNNPGGGMSNTGSDPTVTDCTFFYNGSDGMANRSGSNPTVTNCSFSGNDGDGMNNDGSSPTVTNCSFGGNQGDGMWNRSWSSATVTNCRFEYNEGGGMSNTESSPTVTNCTFHENGTGVPYDGMYNRGSSATVTNCTFLGNRGCGMYNDDSSATVTNCIFWGNTLDDIYGDATVTYSDVGGGWDGEGNISADPLFDCGTLHLSAGSPCIDAGDSGAVPAGVTTDLHGDARFVDDPATPNAGIGTPPVDMGAYEFQGGCEPTLLAHWSLDESSGNTAHDSTGNHSGTLYGDPTWIGGALLFDGQDDVVECGTFNPSEDTGQLTVCLWAKWNGLNGDYQGLIAKRDAWDAEDMMWQLEARHDTGELGFFRRDSGSPALSAALPVGVWTHVAATFNGLTSRLYLDGIEQGCGQLLLGSDTEAHIVIGACQGDGSYSFNGALKDVRVYDCALSANEISSLATPTIDSMIDIGLRVYDGTSVITIACEPEGTLTSPLRIAKNGTTYGIALVDPSDVNASDIRIETSSGVKALRKL